MTDTPFHGWTTLGSDSEQEELIWQQFQPKPFDEDDIESQWSSLRVLRVLKIDGSRRSILWDLRPS